MYEAHRRCFDRFFLKKNFFCSFIFSKLKMLVIESLMTSVVIKIGNGFLEMGFCAFGKNVRVLEVNVKNY